MSHCDEPQSMDCFSCGRTAPDAIKVQTRLFLRRPISKSGHRIGHVEEVLFWVNRPWIMSIWSNPPSLLSACSDHVQLGTGVYDRIRSERSGKIHLPAATEHHVQGLQTRAACWS